MSEKIDIILFDLGGVLIELTGVPTMLNWTGESLTPEKLWRNWLTSPTVRDFETGRIHPDHFAQQLIQEMSLQVSPDEFLEQFTFWPSGFYPGAKQLINRLSSDYILAVLSNSNAIHWPRMMHDMGLVDLFDYYFASHLIGKLKPDIEVFEHVLEELGCNPACVLYVDDNKLNIDAARTLGFQAMETKGIDAVQRVLEDFGII